MAKTDKSWSALQTVHAALKSLTAEERRRVLASVTALFDEAGTGATRSAKPRENTSGGPTTSARPLAIRELIQDKHPRTHSQFITLFAYYREKYQNLPTFSRSALEKYYPDSRETPPANYDRDFVDAVKKGWIHEDGENSYITSKGIEAVETGFSREAAPRAPSKPKGGKKPRKP